MIIELNENEVNMIMVALGQLRVEMSKPQRRIDGSEMPRDDVDLIIGQTYELEAKLQGGSEQ